MKKFLPVFLLFLCIFLLGCPQAKGAGSDAETPLPLTVDNLVGKWALESDASVWYEFKEDESFTSNTVSKGGTFKFENGKLQLYKTAFGGTGPLDNAKSITIYKSYIVIDNKKYLR